jgi:hypothetical protein
VREEESQNGEAQNWERQLREGADELLAARCSPFVDEIIRLRETLDGALARLAERARAGTSEEETAGLEAQVRHLLRTSEEGFHARLTAARAEADAALEREMERHRGDLLFLNAALGAIDARRTQAETLGALIDAAARFAPRIAFFALRGGRAVGWQARGFTGEMDDESVAALSLAPDESTLVGEAISTHRTAVAGADAAPSYFAVLGAESESRPAGAVAVPLVVRGKPAAVLYADGGPGAAAPDAEPLEILVRFTSLAIELLPLRRHTEPLRTIEPPAAEAPPAPELESRPAREPLAPPVDGAAEPARLPDPEPEAVPPPPRPPAFKRVSQAKLSEDEIDTEPGPIFTGDLAESAVGERPLAPLAPDSPDALRAHNDARRYARILVTEIRLFNPAQVADGLRHLDLYDRLRDEIERNRLLYHRHVPREVTAYADYFHEELVNTLAAGDEARLGANCPRPATTMV